MSEVKELDKPKGSPIEGAVNKMREVALGEINKKIAEKVKAATDARKIYLTAKEELKELQKELEFEKINFNDLLKDLK